MDARPGSRRTCAESGRSQAAAPTGLTLYRARHTQGCGSQPWALRPLSRWDRDLRLRRAFGEGGWVAGCSHDVRSHPLRPNVLADTWGVPVPSRWLSKPTLYRRRIPKGFRPQSPRLARPGPALGHGTEVDMNPNGVPAGSAPRGSGPPGRSPYRAAPLSCVPYPRVAGRNPGL